MLEDITHSSRRNMRILLSCRDDDGFDFRSKLAVCIRDRALCLEINHIAYTSDDVSYTKLTALVNSEVVILDDMDSLQTGSRLTDYADPLVIIEEAALIDIDSDCNNHLIKHGKGTLEDIQVTCCERIK